MPAGWFREFAFTAWPSFRPQRWHHIRRDCEKRFATVDRPLICASDTNRKTVHSLSKVVERCGFSGAVFVSHRDFFSFSPKELTRRSGLVVINPPYGLRIGNRLESRDMVSRIFLHLKTAYRGWKFALIVPNRSALKEIPGRCQSTPLVHGGLRLTLVNGKID
jgi:putative N6-adenine-specific DNA methylase